jgi:hypothetical protein
MMRSFISRSHFNNINYLVIKARKRGTNNVVAPVDFRNSSSGFATLAAIRRASSAKSRRRPEETAVTKPSAGPYLEPSLLVGIVVTRFVTQFDDSVFRMGECVRSVWQICAMRIVLNPPVQISDREEI